MKKLPTLLVMLVPLLLATSCQDDDVQLNTTAVEVPQQPQPSAPQEPEAPQDPGQPTTIGERWSLINVSGSIAGISHNFPAGEITWTFDDNGTVDVINNNTDGALEDFLDTGNYTFGFIPNEVPTGCDEIMFIWCFTFGCQSVSGDTMTLTQPENDGYTLTFTKI